MPSNMSHHYRLPDDMEAELQDPEQWDREHAVVGEPVASPTMTYSVRLDPQSARILGDAARKHDMPVSRYLLHAALETARRDLGQLGSTPEPQ